MMMDIREADYTFEQVGPNIFSGFDKKRNTKVTLESRKTSRFDSKMIRRSSPYATLMQSDTPMKRPQKTTTMLGSSGKQSSGKRANLQNMQINSIVRRPQNRFIAMSPDTNSMFEKYLKRPYGRSSRSNSSQKKLDSTTKIVEDRKF